MDSYNILQSKLSQSDKRLNKITSMRHQYDSHTSYVLAYNDELAINVALTRVIVDLAANDEIGLL